ncbi:uncharacterized protein LOC124406540 [Diprion similis]|uniref:uncharacterized protein LOC124406540 n=1 Tax=Diprion similis TaxID=362088 RepID=UPI001EF8EAFD|nr:uncharacterized protein LOC124406540 [Diprion similis]
MSGKNFTTFIPVCWIILRVCVDVGLGQETGQDNTWREWDYHPPHRKCKIRKLDNQLSSANLSQKNQCDYEPKSSDPPSWLQHQQSTLSQDFSVINWNVSTPRENFKLTLLMIPHVKNKTECACDPREDNNLLQNTPNDEDSSLSIKKDIPANGMFIDIFTGCYYFEMKNEEEKGWLWGPYFYNTTNPVHDPTFRCDYEDVSKVAIETNRTLPFNMTIASTCFRLNLMLWEIDKENLTEDGDFDLTTLPPSQRCEVEMIDSDTFKLTAVVCYHLFDMGNRYHGQPSMCQNQSNGPMRNNLTFRCLRNDTDLRLWSQVAFKNLTGGAWSVVVEWTGLKEGAVCHFAEFSQTYISILPGCDDYLNDFLQWTNAIEIGRTKLSCFRDNKKPAAGWTHLELASTSVAILLVSILLLWMFKFFRIRRGGNHVGNDVPFNTINPLLYKDNPKRILIIYTKGPSSFMEEMRSFRDKLKQRCGCPVYDLQSDEDNDLNVEFGSNEWIDRLLKHGCRVIWVDTPQFRLLVENDESRIRLDEDYTVDFRDTSIPFALATAKTLYQDPITQYRDHFIVRWTGFEVTDGPDDPLAVISPHTRFRLPEHFNELCSHLGVDPDFDFIR